MSAEISDFSEKLFQSEVKLYNAQPLWRMREIHVERPNQALEVAREFLHMVDQTSWEFNWPFRDPSDKLKWQVHGWKHVTYEVILNCWTDYCSGFDPVMVRIEGLGEIEEVQRLFSAASREDPEALGIIWSQFPKSEDHNEIMEWIYLPQERPRGLRHPSELAADLVDTIFSMPGSKEADLAKDALLKLISVSVARGSRTRRGRPKTRIPVPTLQLLWKMSHCLAKQIRELADFLERNEVRDEDRRNYLLKAYPWILRIVGGGASRRRASSMVRSHAPELADLRER